MCDSDDSQSDGYTFCDDEAALVERNQQQDCLIAAARVVSDESRARQHHLISPPCDTIAEAAREHTGCTTTIRRERVQVSVLVVPRIDVDDSRYGQELLEHVNPKSADDHVTERNEAYRAAFRYTIPAPSTGDIRVVDVLLEMMLWLEIDAVTLLRVSAVCRTWREASSCLPHWSVTKQLLHPSPALITFARQMPVQRCIDFQLLRGVDVSTRENYIATMRSRWMLQQEARALCTGERRGHAVRSCALHSRLYALTMMIVTIFLVTGILGVCAAIGSRGVHSRALSRDESIGPLTFFVSLGLILVVGFPVLWGVQSLIRPRGLTQRNLRRRPAWPMFMCLVVVCCLLGVPAGLMGARIGQAQQLADRVMHLANGSCSDTWQGGNDVPGYVAVTDVRRWTIADPVNCSTNPSTEVPGTSINSWADHYFNSSLPRPCVSKFIVNSSWMFLNRSSVNRTWQRVYSQWYFPFILLRSPPDWKRCSTGSPPSLAMAYVPSSIEFNATLSSMFGSRATWPNSSGVVTYFRAPTTTAWLRQGEVLNYFGDAWYRGAAVISYSASVSRFWADERLALVGAPASLITPSEVTLQWLWLLFAWWAVACAAVCATFVVVATPRRLCFKTRSLQRLFLFSPAVLVPVAFTMVGIKCAFFHDPNVCYMSRETAGVLFFASFATWAIPILCVIAVKCL